MRSWWIAILLVLLIAGAAFWRREAHARIAPVHRAAIPTVHVVTLVPEDFVATLGEPGTVTSEQNVTIHTMLEAQPLQTLFFHEGDRVKSGQLLALIDPAPYRIALAQAEAQLERDRQLLANAEIDQKRYRDLLAQNSIAEQTKVTQDALVRQDQAIVGMDQAARDNARLQLSYTEIRSPLNGQVGLRQVDPGNILHIADVNGIVSVAQIDPIDVLFSLPQDQVAAYMAAGPHPEVRIYDARAHLLARGRVISQDNHVDVATGTLMLRARFANAQGRLLPNAFVEARLVLLQRHAVIVIPHSALLERGGATAVDVVQQGHVQTRKVVVSAQEGERVWVSQGLRAGDRLIVAGTDRLKDGMAVQIWQDTPVP